MQGLKINSEAQIYHFSAINYTSGKYFTKNLDLIIVPVIFVRTQVNNILVML